MFLTYPAAQVSSEVVNTSTRCRWMTLKRIVKVPCLSLTVTRFSTGIPSESFDCYTKKSLRSDWTLSFWCWHVFLPRRLRKFPCTQHTVLNLWGVIEVLDHFSLVCVRVNSQLSWRSEGGTPSQKPSIKWRVGGHLQGLSSETNSQKAMKTSEKGNLLKLKWRKDDYFHIKLGEMAFPWGNVSAHSFTLLNMLPIWSEKDFYRRTLEVLREFANI